MKGTERGAGRRAMPAILLTSALALAAPAWAHGPAAHGADSQAVAPAQQQAWGIAAAPATPARELHLRMGDDMRFSPATFTVREGETLRLVVENRGAAMHEWVLGTPAALAEHAELMQRFPDMEHDEPWMAHVPAGRQGEIRWTFNRPGRFEFACLIAGHYQSGMRGEIRVIPARHPR